MIDFVDFIDMEDDVPPFDTNVLVCASSLSLSVEADQTNHIRREIFAVGRLSAKTSKWKITNIDLNQALVHGNTSVRIWAHIEKKHFRRAYEHLRNGNFVKSYNHLQPILELLGQLAVFYRNELSGSRFEDAIKVANKYLDQYLQANEHDPKRASSILDGIYDDFEADFDVFIINNGSQFEG